MTLIALALMLGTPAFAGEGAEDDNCTDGVDNDTDDLVDCADDECADDPSCEETEATCDDVFDNDADGDIDCADDDCVDDAMCEETETLCDDSFDNDGDGDIDCDDDDCSENESCTDTGETGDTEDDCDTADTSTDCADEETTGSGAATLAGELGGCGCSASPTPKLAGVSVFLLLGSLLFARRRRIVRAD